jgi:hypothetical protein
MTLPTDQFGAEFFTIIGGMVFAFFGVIIRFAYRSKCRHAKFCCIEIERDVENEMVEDVVAMEERVSLPGEPHIRNSVDGNIKSNIE